MSKDVAKRQQAVSQIGVGAALCESGGIGCLLLPVRDHKIS